MLGGLDNVEQVFGLFFVVVSRGGSWSFTPIALSCAVFVYN